MSSPTNPGAFEPKHEFAMDWYYPVLSGALEGHGAGRRIDLFWDTFVMEGLGVRCVSTGPWVTAAETAECVMALDVVGRREQAASLLCWTAPAHRCADGSLPDGDRLSEDAIRSPRGAHLLHWRSRGAGSRRALERHARFGPLPWGNSAHRGWTSPSRVGWSDPSEHSKGAALAVLDEFVRVDGGTPQVVGRPPTVGRIGEHVVDGQASLLRSPAVPNP